MSIRSLLKLRWINTIVITAALGVFPVLAQNANFESITLSSNSLASAPSLRGYTDGSFSLSSIANRDRNGNLCLGYADSTPDHILVLEQDFSQLSLRVNSGGSDTTLLVQGPNDNTQFAAATTPETTQMQVFKIATGRLGIIRSGSGRSTLERDTNTR